MSAPELLSGLLGRRSAAHVAKARGLTVCGERSGLRRSRLRDQGDDDADRPRPGWRVAQSSDTNTPTTP